MHLQSRFPRARYPAIMRYLWQVVTGLVTLLVIFHIYSTLTNNLPAIVLFSSSIIVVLSVTTSAAHISLQNADDFALNARLALKTHELLHRDQREIEAEYEELKEHENATAKATQKFYINAAFNTVFLLIAIYHLVFLA